MPALIAADIYRQSGRWEVFGQEMFRLKDRNARDFCLGPTHEELFTELIKSWLHSYKSLPITLYQIQTKFRDEFRPRYGVIRAREFIMKDAYSFDADAEGLDRSYARMYDAYLRIFDRLGLSYLAVDADTGAMGGSGSQEFMVYSPYGEDDIVRCSACQYASNLEKAGYAVSPPAREEPAPLAELSTPGIHTIAEITAFLGCAENRVAKTLIYTADGAPVAVMLRGGRSVNETKLRKLLGCSELALADAAAVEAATGAAVGFAGPVGLAIPVYADRELCGQGNLVVGANKTDFHLTGANPERDFTVKAYADLGNAAAGDACPICGGALGMTRGVEVGHIFKLGRRYTDALGVRFINEQGVEDTPVMGCYGIGVSRLIAAVIEQHSDQKGIVWPGAVAPFHAIVVALGRPGSAELEAAQSLYLKLCESGAETLLDDRNERAGVKFTDADLIGIPLRVTVGRRAAEGIVELKYRDCDTVREVSFAEAVREAAEFARAHAR